MSFILFTGWTSYTFFSDTSKASDITLLVKDIYQLQKSFLLDVIDLSKVLINNSKELDFDLPAKPEFIEDSNKVKQLTESLTTDMDDDISELNTLPLEEYLKEKNTETDSKTDQNLIDKNYDIID
tara:strand:+ start:362 stop:736 length:375 start_codon:yes stop_codon:yes gene_type:complete